MNEMVQRLIDQVFAGRDTVEKTELVNKGESMGLPGAISDRLRQLPEGQVSRSQSSSKWATPATWAIWAICERRSDGERDERATSRVGRRQASLLGLGGEGYAPRARCSPPHCVAASPSRPINSAAFFGAIARRRC